MTSRMRCRRAARAVIVICGALAMSGLLWGAYSVAAQTRDPATSACAMIPGVWPWFINGDVTFRDNGTLSQGDLTGRWTCDGATSSVSIVWSHGFTDRLTLSPDGTQLAGTNLQGDRVTLVQRRRAMPSPAPRLAAPSAPPAPPVIAPAPPATPPAAAWRKLAFKAVLGARPDNAESGALGVELANMENLARVFGLQVPKGYLVFTVQPGSSAEKAGIRKGDLITAVAGDAPRTFDHLISLTSRHPPNSEVAVEVWRFGAGYEDLKSWVDRQAATNAAAAVFVQGALASASAKDDFGHAAAFQLFRQAAILGSVAAMEAMGDRLMGGLGAAKNAESAFMWYERAAARGSRYAMSKVARMLVTGEGVKQNVEQSFVWMKKAADAGEPAANYDLAVYYDQGYGTRKRPELGAQHMIRAIRDGDTRLLALLTSNFDRTFGAAFRAALLRNLRDAGHYNGPNDTKLNPKLVIALMRLQIERKP